MPSKRAKPEATETDLLLEKLVFLKLYEISATHDQIGRFLGRRNEWVTSMLKLLPKRER